MLANMMRWVRVRGLLEGLFQKGRIEGLPHDVRDGVSRPQDYGFAANPLEGEGLRMEVGGHTIIIRLDRTAERPQLPAYEVAVWHKEGHMVRLREGRVVQVDCDEYIVNTMQYTVNASTAATFNSPVVNASQDVVAMGGVKGETVGAATSLKVGGKEVLGHHHGNVQNGLGNSANF